MEIKIYEIKACIVKVHNCTVMFGYVPSEVWMSPTPITCEKKC
jgi:hypothetical protein